MKHMSEGMQAIAGNSLRRMISAVTSHPLMATGVGVLFTMLVQSSSITTVMVVGFVNSGLMTLSQGIGVVMGANIGTTITGWILVLKIGKYGLPLVGVSAFVYLFSRREKLRYIALPFLGLGMVFLGLDLMKNGFAMVKELPAFEEWFHQFDTKTYLGILSCAMVGCVLTFIVQSSSATLGITIGLAQIGVIPFETAAALVMGENIGTTITAWLASLGATTTNAKRVAYFHVLFNLVGVLWITSIFHPYLKLVGLIVTGDYLDPVVVTAAIATTHTVFNVTNTLLFLGLTGPSARLMTRLIPDRETRLQETKLTTLDIRMLETPSIAVEQSRSEISNMSTSCLDMMGQLRHVNLANPTDDRAFDDILKQEALLDCYQAEVVEFMSHLLSANIPHALTDEIRSQLRLADEYESVSDCIASAVKACRKLHHQGHTLPEREQTSLLELHDLTTTFLKNVARAYTDDSTIDMSAAKEQADQITRQVKQLASIDFSQSSQATEQKLEPQVTVAYNRQLTAYRRIRDHILNIAEAVGGIK
ncbi:MAG: Na/Pi cotransporter family protein [Planctomycetaceae bacterium]